MRKIIALLLATACVVPALAFAAANPAKNSHFAWCPKKDRCPLDFDTNKKGTKIINLSIYSDCAPVPIKSDTGAYPPIRVKQGKFRAKGSVKDVTNQTLNYEIAGRFTTPKKAVGTFDIDRKDCKDADQKFTAKRDGKAKGQPF